MITQGEKLIEFKILGVFGMLSPILYTLMWVLGGFLVPGYSHIRKDVSSLYAVGAPKRKIFQSFIVVSSILLLVFYIGLHWSMNDGGGSVIGPALFVMGGILGVLVALFFPLDAGGEMTTWRGKMHLILIVLSGILTVLGMVAISFRLGIVQGWEMFAQFSLVAAVVTFALVMVSGAFIKSKYMGLIERIMVSSYQVYYFVFGLMVFFVN